MRDLRDEAYYINKLERLLKGEEPKNERQKVERNRQIAELQGKIKDFAKEEVAANKFYGESDAGNRKLEKLEDELDRIRFRRLKEKTQKGSKEDKEILKDEQELLDKIEAEQALWDAEKDAAAVAKKEYRRLETERNRQIERVDNLKKKLKSISDGNLPVRQKREIKPDTPEIDAIKDEIKRAENFIRSAKATQKRISDMEAELQRLKNREEKEPTEKNKRDVTDREKDLKEQISKERKLIREEESEANKFYVEDVPEEVRKLITIRKRNESEEKKIRERIAKGDFETEKKKPFLEDPEMQKKFPKQYNAALDAIKKKEDARHEFDIALLRDQMSRRTLAEKATDNLSKTLGTVKAITTGIDDSAVAIQTYMSMLVRPRTGATAFYQHIRQGASQKKFDRWLTALHSSSDFKEMKDMGLDVTEPSSLKEREKEEIFNNRLTAR